MQLVQLYQPKKVAEEAGMERKIPAVMFVAFYDTSSAPHTLMMICLVSSSRAVVAGICFKEAVGKAMM